jgi:hypothetical protein
VLRVLVLKVLKVLVLEVLHGAVLTSDPGRA